jgi:hypothetical protein
MKKKMFQSKKIYVFLLLMVLVGCQNSVYAAKGLSIKIIDKCLESALLSAKLMSASLGENPTVLPRSTDKTGQLTTSAPDWWTSGFYPGELWYLYEYSRSSELKNLAIKYSNLVEDQKYATDNHDIGFMLYCSFGNGLRLTNDVRYKEILTTAAQSLMKRYNPTVGLIRSWDFNKDIWQYPVIIDNMMNLELLFWAAKETKNTEMYQAAVSHADKTLEHHFRPDYSCWHVVSYDTVTGLPHIKQTHQGLNDSSSWARGQAWALYGYTMVYRETGEKRFLNQANNIARYIMTHSSIPADKVPLWDFDASCNAPRDASAAALIASSLIELADFVPEKQINYLKFAEQQLLSLSSREYSAEPGTNANFILKHSVGNYPAGYEIDAPLSYADYYYVEALIRYRNILIRCKKQS